MSSVRHRSKVAQGGWTQLENVLLFDQALSPGAKLLFMALRHYAWKGDGALPSQEEIAVALGASRRSIIDWGKELKEAGLITMKRRRNQPAEYVIEDVGSAKSAHPRSAGSAQPEVQNLHIQNAPAREDVGQAVSSSALRAAAEPAARAQQITAYYVDASRLAGAQPMRRMIGVVAQQVGELLDNGYEPIVVSTAIDRMIAQRLNPTTLSSLAYEVKLGPAKASAKLPPPAKTYLCPVCPDHDLRSASRLADHIHVLHPELEQTA